MRCVWARKIPEGLGAPAALVGVLVPCGQVRGIATVSEQIDGEPQQFGGCGVLLRRAVSSFMAIPPPARCHHTIAALAASAADMCCMRSSLRARLEEQ